jgi:ParB/RepB/Spo0J family partition protein
MNDKISRLMAGGGNIHVGLPPVSGVLATRDTFKIPVDQIDPDPENARKSFDGEELAALADDMKRHGQIQNAVAYLEETTNRYRLVAGERRWRACKLAGIPALVCLVLPRQLADEAKAEMAFAENMARADLKPTEVAAHWKVLLSRWQCSTRELAARIGVSQSTISRRLALLQLDTDTQQAVDAGQVHKTHVVEAQRTRRRSRAGRRAPRGVVETVAAGSIRLKRGHTLAGLIAELQAMDTGQAETVPAAA